MRACVRARCVCLVGGLFCSRAQMFSAVISKQGKTRKNSTKNHQNVFFFYFRLPVYGGLLAFGFVCVRYVRACVCVWWFCFARARMFSAVINKVKRGKII